MDISILNNQAATAAAVRLPATESARRSGGVADVEADKAHAAAANAEESAGANGPRDSVEAAVSTIQEFVQTIRRNLSFDLDDSSGRVVVKVTDSESGEVIRQIPSEEALKLAESLSEVRSLLFKAEA